MSLSQVEIRIGFQEIHNFSCRKTLALAQLFLELFAQYLGGELGFDFGL